MSVRFCSGWLQVPGYLRNLAQMFVGGRHDQHVTGLDFFVLGRVQEGRASSAYGQHGYTVSVGCSGQPGFFKCVAKHPFRRPELADSEIRNDRHVIYDSGLEPHMSGATGAF